MRTLKQVIVRARLRVRLVDWFGAHRDSPVRSSLWTPLTATTGDTQAPTRGECWRRAKFAVIVLYRRKPKVAAKTITELLPQFYRRIELSHRKFAEELPEIVEKKAGNKDNFAGTLPNFAEALHAIYRNFTETPPPFSPYGPFPKFPKVTRNLPPIWRVSLAPLAVRFAGVLEGSAREPSRAPALQDVPP
eukprot:gene7919-biopygen6090